MTKDSLYDSEFVKSLFDEMATTYGVLNLLSSFGFTVWWRRKCATAIDIRSDAVVVDLMAGMGELCTELSKHLTDSGELIALDISPVMCAQAEKHNFKNKYSVVETDALNNPLANSSSDHVFSSFGLKTFNQEQILALSKEVARILRPGGTFSFLEISIPPNPILRIPFLFYLNRVVPILGRIFLGNPDNYRLLGVYTTNFGNCDVTAKLFSDSGLVVEKKSYFFGCATGIIGSKPLK